MPAPRASILIPCYNDADRLPDALKSVLAQLGPEDEVLVLDDGSDPPLDGAAALPADPRLRLERLPHRGVAAARNAGLDRARGRYALFLDADDRMLPGRIEAQVGLLAARPELIAAGGDITRVDESGREDSWGIFETWPRALEATPGPLPDSHILGADFRDEVLEAFPWNTSVLALNLERVRKAGLRFDEGLPCWEDWDFVARAARLGPLGYIRRPLIRYHRHAGSITATPDPAKFAGRARMFQRWAAEFQNLDPARHRLLRRAAAASWLTASYESRADRPERAWRWGLRALAGAPLSPRSWKNLTAAGLRRLGVSV